jgi:DNA-binding NarL/FixJ family response regulator
MIRVLIVDDHSVVRRGLETLLRSVEDIEVVGTATDGEGALRCAGELKPDVVLMDLSMPNVDGIESTRRLLAEHPEMRVVVLTSFAEQRKVFDALAAGANGYLLKDATPDQLIAGVRAAYAGGSPLDPKAARMLVDARRDASVAPALSPRETEVLREVAEGFTNKHIAKRLGIGERTVKAHLTAVFQKIDVADRTQAAMWARENLPDL